MNDLLTVDGQSQGWLRSQQQQRQQPKMKNKKSTQENKKQIIVIVIVNGCLAGCWLRITTN